MHTYTHKTHTHTYTFTYIHVHKTHTYMYYTYMYAHIFIYMGQFPPKLPLKIPLRLNHYNFQTVKAIDFLFSTLHTTPFLYDEICFGVLQCVILQGSNPPNTFRFSCNQIAFKIRFVGREVPVPIAANCVPLYQAGKCACRDLSIYKPNLKRFDYSYQKFR